jgi:hypothetical protein
MYFTCLVMNAAKSKERERERALALEQAGRAEVSGLVVVVVVEVL